MARAIRAEVVVVEEVAGAKAVLVRIPAGASAPGMAASRGGHPDARSNAVVRHVVEHLVVPGLAIIVVDMEEVHPHLSHLVQDELPILPRIRGRGLRKVGPRQDAADAHGGLLALIHVRQSQRRLLLGQNIATEIKADAVMLFQQAVHAIQATLFIAAGDDENLCGA